MELQKVVDGLKKQGAEWNFRFVDNALEFSRLSLDATTYTRVVVSGVVGEGDGCVNVEKLSLAVKGARKPKLSVVENGGLLLVETTKRTTRIPLKERIEQKTIDFQKFRDAVKGCVVVESAVLKRELNDIIAFSGEKGGVSVTLEGVEGRLLLKYTGYAGDVMTTSVENKNLMVQEVTVDATLLKNLLVFDGEVSLWFRWNNPLVLRYERGGVVVESALAPRVKNE